VVATLAKADSSGFFIGTQQRLKLVLAKNSAVGGHTVSSFAPTLVPTDTTNYVAQNINGEADLTGNPEVNVTVNYKGSTKVNVTGIQTSPLITYNLAGLTVTSRLTTSDGPTASTPIVFGDIAFAGVKVVGVSAASEKASITGTDGINADISNSTIRSNIRKNAATITLGIKNGDTVSGVKYVEGDYKLESNPLWTTLVVKNGNLLIENNVQPSSLVGILVVSETASKGSVYVKPNVTAIHAAIYADGSMESVDSSGNIFTQDTLARTRILQNQLILKGALFTNNTIGGAILGTSGKYLLPLGKTTTDLGLAIRFDLNYIRRGNTGCDLNANGKCTDTHEYTNPFVIIADPSLQTNPPK